MRYLKRFNESRNDTIQNVNDILLPINDMGYDVNVVSNDYAKELFIRVVTWTDKPLLITGDVREEFMRMKDYLQSEGYNSVKAKYYLENRSQDETPYKQAEKDFDDFINFINKWQEINIEVPIVNLIFVAKKSL